MIFRSKAPLRIGLAGGGTDVSPYSDQFGGAILNATISLFAYSTITLLKEKKIIFESLDKQVSIEFDTPENIHPGFELHYGVYKKIADRFSIPEGGFKLSTKIDAPPGSGLGSSSASVVSILGAFTEWLKLPFGTYELAHLAFEIERKDLKMEGGKQDQYASTFGGFNFMTFGKNDKVIVDPLSLKKEFILELEHNLLLFYTKTTRNSSVIIKEQQANVKNNKVSSIEAMHNLKEQSILMKNVFLKNNIDEIGPLLDYGYKEKIKMADGISNPFLEEIYHAAISAGATGGKISGAGGGGYFMFYCPGNSKYLVIDALNNFGGHFENYRFENEGLTSWSI